MRFKYIEEDPANKIRQQANDHTLRFRFWKSHFPFPNLKLQSTLFFFFFFEKLHLKDYSSFLTTSALLCSFGHRVYQLKKMTDYYAGC